MEKARTVAEKRTGQKKDSEKKNPFEKNGEKKSGCGKKNVVEKKGEKKNGCGKKKGLMKNGLTKNGLKKNGRKGLKKIDEVKNDRAKNGLFKTTGLLKKNGFVKDDEWNMNRDETELSEPAVANVPSFDTWPPPSFVLDGKSGRGTKRLMTREPRGVAEL